MEKKEKGVSLVLVLKVPEVYQVLQVKLSSISKHIFEYNNIFYQVILESHYLDKTPYVFIIGTQK